MSLVCKVLMNADREALIKLVAEGSGSYTLDLDDLCYKPNDSHLIDTSTCQKFQQPFSYKSLRVAVRSLQWTGEDGAKIICKRNNEPCFTVVPQCTGTINLSGELGYADDDNDTSDLVFESSGGSMQLWVLLRKNDYKSFIEEAVFGVYDDPTKVDDPSA